MDPEVWCQVRLPEYDRLTILDMSNSLNVFLLMIGRIYISVGTFICLMLIFRLSQSSW